MKLKKVLSNVLIFAIAVPVGLTLQYALADWSPAPGNPPSNNVPAPVNVGDSYQAKSGGLTLGASVASSSIPLDVEGIGYIQALILGKDSGSTFQYLDGNEGAGKVLTSDASGNATWQSSAAASGGIVLLDNPPTLVKLSSYTADSWYTVSLGSDGVPSDATAVILATKIDAYNDTNDVGIYERAASSTATFQLAGTKTSGGGAPSLGGFSQGIYPVSASGGSASLQYEADGNLTNSTITLVGYVGPQS